MDIKKDFQYRQKAIINPRKGFYNTKGENFQNQPVKTKIAHLYDGRAEPTLQANPAPECGHTA
jgi:hypothetical protein